MHQSGNNAKSEGSSIVSLTASRLNRLLPVSTRNKLAKILAIQTGQTVSYTPGDDGDLKIGRLANFYTMASDNDFGNTKRFTDELGLQVYANNYLIDHASGLGWYLTIAGGGPAWAAASATAATLSININGGAVSGFFIPNIKQLIDLYDWSLSGGGLNYAPFNLINANLWASTTVGSNTTRAYVFNTNTPPTVNGAVGKISTGLAGALYCRRHYTT